MAALAMLIWVKVILAIESNRTVGPMLKMIIVMTKDLATFIVLWSAILIFFLCVGQLVFVDVETFQSIETTLDFLINAALGNFDVELFEQPYRTICVIDFKHIDEK